MKTKIILLCIILLGAFFRFYSLNWDSFQAFHPDERNISWAVTRIHFFDQMNPKFFAYGGLPVYLYRAIGEAVVRVTHDPEWLHDWGHIAVIGRYASATLSTISILLIFLVGSSYFSRVTGLASAAFLAFSPWAIQQAHFSTTETMLVFFIFLLLWISKKILAAGSEKKLPALIGIAVIWGLALAAKTTAFSFGIIPIAAIWFPLLTRHASTREFIKIFFQKIVHTLILFTISAGIFFLFSPYTILDFPHFSESMTYEGGVVSGRLPVPYTLQFTGTTPYLYQLQTMFWQGGIVTIVGIIGLVLLIFKSLLTVIPGLTRNPFLNAGSRLGGRDDKLSIFLLFVFPLTYFAIIGSWFAKFNRYNVLILPFLAIAAAWLCAFFIKKFRVAGFVFTTLLLTAAFVWTIANASIYTRPQTRISATEWIYQNIPETAKLYTEHWNDGLPLDLPDSPYRYKRELLEVYEKPDNDQKILYYAARLPKADYIILSTRRIWATMPYLTEQYPVTSLFYEKLLAGLLGYKEVATFSSYPELFGLKINDDVAEESLQVFDHPTVRIFQNTEHLSSETLKQILTQ